MRCLLYLVLSFFIVMDLSANDRCTRSATKKAAVPPDVASAVVRATQEVPHCGVSPKKLKKVRFQESAAQSRLAVGERDEDGNTFLHLEVLQGNAKFFDDLCADQNRCWRLLEKGFVNFENMLMSRNNLGKIPLHLALHCRNSSIALSLVTLMKCHAARCREKIKALIESQQRPLDYFQQKKELAEAHLGYYIPGVSEDREAACSGIEAISRAIKGLEQQAIDFNSLTLNKQTPLDLAMEYNLDDVGQELIKITMGKRIGEKLLQAIFNRDVYKALQLIRYNAHVDAKSLWLENNALHTAIEKRLPDVVDAILGSKSGVDLINRSNNIGRTPIYSAIALGNTHLVLKIVAMSASLEHQDYRGFTPAAFARSCGQFYLAYELDRLQRTDTLCCEEVLI